MKTVESLTVPVKKKTNVIKTVESLTISVKKEKKGVTLYNKNGGSFDNAREKNEGKRELYDKKRWNL